ncbi:MAG: ATP cone domain-containing protein, partial [Candidatus Bathyarchaeia archaeon]
MPPQNMRKRDGKVEQFSQDKITNAIFKALSAGGVSDKKLATELSTRVARQLEERFSEGVIPSVEDIQDLVEEILIKGGYPETAKRYILYRQKRTEIRETKQFLGVSDDLKLSVNAVRVLRRRYLLRDNAGNIVETPRQMMRRVAEAVVHADLLYGAAADAEKSSTEFQRMMTALDFLPNSPTLMNAGTDI